MTIAPVAVAAEAAQRDWSAQGAGGVAVDALVGDVQAPPPGSPSSASRAAAHVKRERAAASGRLGRRRSRARSARMTSGGDASSRGATMPLSCDGDPRARDQRPCSPDQTGFRPIRSRSPATSASRALEGAGEVERSCHALLDGPLLVPRLEIDGHERQPAEVGVAPPGPKGPSAGSTPGFWRDKDLRPCSCGSRRRNDGAITPRRRQRS